MNRLEMVECIGFTRILGGEIKSKIPNIDINVRDAVSFQTKQRKMFRLCVHKAFENVPKFTKVIKPVNII